MSPSYASLVCLLALGACSKLGATPPLKKQMAGAVTSPLKDLNLIHDKIPSVLIAAQQGPYAAPANATCEGLKAEILLLDAALGADLDAPSHPEDRHLVSKAAVEQAAVGAVEGATVGAVRSAAEALIPYRSWVRKLTGAERFSRQVTKAIGAGVVRRAYLKGLAQAQGCNAPVATVAAAPKVPGMWMKELAGAEGVGFTGYPQNLGWQAEHPSSYPAPFLVVGQRPLNDTPEASIQLSGAKQSDTDWVIADTSGALWVTGLLPAPKPGEAVLISGRFTTKDGKVALKGVRFLLAGNSTGTTLAKPGDFVYFPLSGTKSTTCPVVLEGGAAEVAFTDERDTLILRTVKPGTVKIQISSLGFNDDQPTSLKELLLTVE